MKQKKDYLKSTYNPDTEIYEIEVVDIVGQVIRSYCETYNKEDAEFICSSYNARPELEQNAYLLFKSMTDITEKFDSFQTAYSEYKKLIEEAKELLKKVVE